MFTFDDGYASSVGNQVHQACRNQDMVGARDCLSILVFCCLLGTFTLPVLGTSMLRD